MVILSTSFVTPDWQIPGTSWAVILPLAYVYYFFLEFFLELTNFLYFWNTIESLLEAIFCSQWVRMFFFIVDFWANYFFIFPPFQIVLNPWLMIFSYWMFWTSLGSITYYLFTAVLHTSFPTSQTPFSFLTFLRLLSKNIIIMRLFFRFWTLSLLLLFFFSFILPKPNLSTTIIIYSLDLVPKKMISFCAKILLYLSNNK